jgi:hypothetical protein
MSIGPTGQIRWTTDTDGGAGRIPPVLGANGSVFFQVDNGFQDSVLGFNKDSGAKTFAQGPDYLAGFHAYQGGLAEVNVGGSASYYGYDEQLLTTVGPSPAVTNDGPSSNIAGANGTVFVAGYATGGDTSGAPLSVSKMTPSGIAWTWTDSGSLSAYPSLAATPDGGVAVMAFSTASNEPEVVSLSPSGGLRWRQSYPLSERDAGYQVLADVKGVLAIQTHFDYYPDPFDPSTTRTGVEVQFLSAQTGNTALTPVLAIDPTNGDFGITIGTGVSIGSDRVYIPESYNAPPSVSAFSVPGLGEDYQVSLQEALAPGGGSPPPNDGGPSPAPPPTIYRKASTNPCGTVHGGFVKRLLAAAKCTWAQTLMEAKCGVAISGFIFLPLKSLRAAKTASGLLDLRKLAVKFRPAAKVYNALSLAKYTPDAPRGFKSFGEVRSRIQDANDAHELVTLLPDLRQAISARDLHEIALDIADVADLNSCVEGLANAMAS